MSERELSEQANSLPLQIVGQTGPDVRDGQGRFESRWLMSHGGPSQKLSARAAGGMVAPGPRAKNATRSAGRFGETSLPTEFIDPLGHLSKALEVEKVRSANER